MFLGLHLLAGKYLFNDALLINNKGGADGTFGFFAVHHLLAPGTHRLQQRLVDISNQRERQFMLLLEQDGVASGLCWKMKAWFLSLTDMWICSGIFGNRKRSDG